MSQPGTIGFMSGRRELVPVSNYLRHLLNTAPIYRARWLDNVQRSAGSPNVDAVSRVLLDHHAANIELYPWPLPESHRGYRDRVARALSAASFSAQTLDLFVRAFSMTEADSSMLERLLHGPQVDGLWNDSPLGTTIDGESRAYQTTSLHEIHEVGADRLPKRHRTIHTIEALKAGVAGHDYVFDTPNARVHAVAGADAGPVEPYEMIKGFWRCHLSFREPLQQGQVRFFEYVTEFAYEDAPPPEMRRGSQFPLQMLSLRATFDPEAIPSAVWWTRWPKLDASPDMIEKVELDEELAACKVRFDLEPGDIWGFVWEW